MPRELEDSPIVKLVNMLLLDMIKKQMPMARVRADGPCEVWSDGRWAPEMTPPAKILAPMIDRLKDMADIPDDAPLSFQSKIRLAMGKGRLADFDLTYSRSAGDGVAVITRHALAPTFLPSNEDVMNKAMILLSHAGDALARQDARARVRDAVERVKQQGAYAWFLRNAAWTCIEMGIYDDALGYLETARKLHTGYETVLVHIDVQLGDVFAETNRVKEAEAAYARALAIAESLPRPTFHEVPVLIQVALLALEGAELAAAETALARADAIVELLFGPKSLARLLLHPARVRLMRARGDAANAETLAVASMREAEDGGLVGEAEALREQLAEIALARGDAPAAVEHARAILQLPSRSPMRARTYATLARAQRATGRDTDAVSSLRAARALVEESLAADHPLRVEIERDIATLTATTPYR